MSKTRTGQIPIGFRNNIRHWQEDVTKPVEFAKANGFESIDISKTLAASQVRSILDTGLRIGSLDLKWPWSDLSSPDAGKRRAAAEANARYINEMAGLGVRNFFCVIIPEDPAAPRTESLQHTIDGFGQICAAVADSGARIVLEGWPGTHPYYAHLACTPETYRAVFDGTGSDVMGVNYDPSHLIRMGIDHVRFLEEFMPRVYHVHAKDTEILVEAQYEYGHLQAATLAEPIAFGGHHWRYTIPGHGVTRWCRIAALLRDAGFDGALSIELEDGNFFDTPADLEHGLIASRDFLVHL